MTIFGRNMKLTVAKRHRDRLRAVFTEALGATNQRPSDDFELFLLEDGFNIGVYFADERGMSADDARDHGVWLELLVDDVDATEEALAGFDVRPFDYAVDPAHKYFVLPGGPVFRLDPKG